MNHFILKLRTLLLYNSFYYLLLSFSIIYLIIYVNNYNLISNYDLSDNEFYVTINKIQIDGNHLSLEVMGKENIRCNYYFETLEEKNLFINDYSLNDYIYLKGTLKIPDNNTIPNQFNYKEYLNHNGVYYLLDIEKYKLIYKNRNIIYSFKNYILKRLGSINNEYLYAFVLGNTRMMENDTINNYKINGVTHLFAISGLHVSIISGLLIKLLKKLDQKISFIIVIFFLIMLCFITSFTPSILRATIFFILLNINKIFYFYIKSSNLLYLTFIILIIYNPLYIYNLGFILSFTITYFLILFNENNKVDNKIKSLLVTSIISNVASLVIIINTFYEINILSFINNIFFIPFVSCIVYPFSLIVFVFPFFEPILNLLTGIMETISLISSKYLTFTLGFQKVSLSLIIIYYILLILIIKYKKKVYTILLCLLIILFYNISYFNDFDYIYFIDVSQGDSILIRTEHFKTILIDTGGGEIFNQEKWKEKKKKYSLMKNSLIPFFNSIGVKKIDYLILTHGDADHSGETITLINNYKVNNVLFNTGNLNSLELKIIDVLKTKNINYNRDLSSIDIDNLSLKILNTKDYNNENENSIVIYINYKNNKFLLMGDAGIKKEKDIIDKFNIKNIDFLKIGHHGSNSSSSKTFIDSVNPRNCIISVGINNRFGHPKESVLKTLENCNIYRTDKQGSIVLKLEDKIKIKTINP